jgi:hypothetical protein
MYIHKENGNVMTISERITLSADVASAPIPANLRGGYLFSVEVKSTADDAVVVTIKSELGTTLYTTTTTGAIAGEIGYPSSYWPLNGVPTYTVSGLGSGSVTIEITVVKQ